MSERCDDTLTWCRPTAKNIIVLNECKWEYPGSHSDPSIVGVSSQTLMLSSPLLPCAPALLLLLLPPLIAEAPFSTGPLIGRHAQNQVRGFSQTEIKGRAVVDTGSLDRIRPPVVPLHISPWKASDHDRTPAGELRHSFVVTSWNLFRYLEAWPCLRERRGSWPKTVSAYCPVSILWRWVDAACSVSNNPPAQWGWSLVCSYRQRSISEKICCLWRPAECDWYCVSM